MGYLKIIISYFNANVPRSKSGLVCMSVCTYVSVCVQISAADPGFPRGSANPKEGVPTYYLAKNSPKTALK